MPNYIPPWDKSFTPKSTSWDLPILRGKVLPPTEPWKNECFIAVYCPWCDKNHVHGWDKRNGSSVIKLRAAHCGFYSPSPWRSYYIAPYRQREFAWRGHPKGRGMHNEPKGFIPPRAESR